MDELTPHIGTLREKPLHASLKQWYAQSGDRTEVPVDGYVIDLVRNDLLIEIQTRGFSNARRKFGALLDLGHRLRIVHPIAVDKWIVKLDADGTVLSRRRSPRHGTTTDVFKELVSIPNLLTREDLEIEVVSTNQEEYRAHTPGRSWRRKGWSVVERRLIDVIGTYLIEDTDDLVALLPSGLPERFTTADLALELGRPRREAQQMAYCLRKAGVILATGNRGHSVEYAVG